MASNLKRYVRPSSTLQRIVDFIIDIANELYDIRNNKETKQSDWNSINDKLNLLNTFVIANYPNESKTESQLIETFFYPAKNITSIHCLEHTLFHGVTYRMFLKRAKYKHNVTTSNSRTSYEWDT